MMDNKGIEMTVLALFKSVIEAGVPADEVDARVRQHLKEAGKLIRECIEKRDRSKE